MELIKDIIQALLGAVVVAAVPVLATNLLKLLSAGVQKIKAGTAKIKDESTRSLINSLLYTAENILIDAVEATNQTFVNSIKSGGSKLTEEQAKIAFNKTKDAVLEVLTEEAKDAIITTYKSIDQWFELKIESAVARNKK